MVREVQDGLKLDLHAEIQITQQEVKREEPHMKKIKTDYWSGICNPFSELTEVP